MKNELLHLNDEEIYRLAKFDNISDLKYAVLHIEKCGECREKIEKVKLAESRVSLFSCSELKDEIKSRMTREIISRGLIVKGNRFLVCRRKGSDYWFFPGGHIDPEENGKEALVREIKEERGSQIEVSDFVGVIENFFKQDGKKISEINLIFLAREPEDTDETISKEDHLEFKFIELDDFEKEKVLPFVLKGAIIQWIQDGKPFYFGSDKRVVE